ncbi:hypothetical protein U1Q18_052513 [Sarracenia purpurea var. burkii]
MRAEPGTLQKSNSKKFQIWQRNPPNRPSSKETTKKQQTILDSGSSNSNETLQNHQTIPDLARINSFGACKRDLEYQKARTTGAEANRTLGSHEQTMPSFKSTKNHSKMDQRHQTTIDLT